MFMGMQYDIIIIIIIMHWSLRVSLINFVIYNTAAGFMRMSLTLNRHVNC